MFRPSAFPILLVLLCSAFAAWAGQPLEIVWVDVEGGAATLLRTPAGETVLIDSGNPGRRDPERIVKAVGLLGERRIDHLVTTHYHVDHYGGAAELSQLLPIGTVYDNGEFANMPDRPDKAYREFRCERRTVLQPGQPLAIKQPEGKDATSFEIVCLATRQEFASAPEGSDGNAAICAGLRTKDRDGSDNANSAVLLVKFGEFRFFDAGDLTWNMENRLVCPQNLVGEVDVYQVTHHGLDASNNPLVIESLRPTVAIMNNGTTKGCMPEVFETLQNQRGLAAIFQMHKNLRPDGDRNNAPEEFIANLEARCEGNVIRLTVAPDGSRYKVSLPHASRTWDYETRKKAPAPVK